jgi:hypothetical protein
VISKEITGFLFLKGPNFCGKKTDFAGKLTLPLDLPMPFQRPPSPPGDCHEPSGDVQFHFRTPIGQRLAGRHREQYRQQQHGRL